MLFDSFEMMPATDWLQFDTSKDEFALLECEWLQCVLYERDHQCCDFMSAGPDVCLRHSTEILIPLLWHSRALIQLQFGTSCRRQNRRFSGKPSALNDAAAAAAEALMLKPVST